MAGGLCCWGRGASTVSADAATGRFAALALGETGVCRLRINSTIHCFGAGVAALPSSLADAQYISVKAAQDSAFCGVLMEAEAHRSRWPRRQQLALLTLSRNGGRVWLSSPCPAMEAKLTALLKATAAGHGRAVQFPLNKIIPQCHKHPCERR